MYRALYCVLVITHSLVEEVGFLDIIPVMILDQEYSNLEADCYAVFSTL
jgi:hypothetical protein